MALPHDGVVRLARIINGDGTPVFVFAPDADGVNRLAVNALAGGIGGTPAVRNADNDDDFAMALLAWEVNSRTGSLDNTTANYRRNRGDSLTASAGGIAAASVYGEWAMAMVHGYSLTGAPGAVPVEARTPVNVDNTLAAGGPVSLSANSQLFGRDSSDGTLRLLETYLTLAAAQPALGVVESRETGYADMIRGRRFFVTHQTPSTVLTAQAAFVATTPTLLNYNSAGNASTLVPRSLNIAVKTASLSPVLVTVAIDTADRYASGGTLVTPQNADESSVTAYPGTAVRYNPTASAAGAGTRYLVTFAIPSGAGMSATLLFKDGVRVVGVGSLLVYIYDSAGAAAPDVWINQELAAFA